jgi:hypothetical protein
MSKIAYVKKHFNAEHSSVIDRVNEIVENYRDQGLVLTLRQVYYQFVAHDYFPYDRTWTRLESGKWVRDTNGTKNADPNYKWLGDVIGDARMAGEIDWEAIEDRTRYIRKFNHWSDPSEIISAVAKQFRIDTWSDQPKRPEVWIEKDALIGVVEAACQPLDVAHFSCRGYTSSTAMHDAALRLIEYYKAGQTPVVFHLGDHDPSGCDMSRDIQDRLNLVLEYHHYEPISINRLALNMPQVRQYNPPPNPAKLTDARAKEYVAEHGNESWELDALEPTVLIKLITSSINSVCNKNKLRAKVGEQNTHRKLLTKCSDAWDRIAKQLQEETA